MKEASTPWDLDTPTEGPPPEKRRVKKEPKPKTKAKEARVSAAYHRTCSGVQVGIFDLSKIFSVGMLAIEEGADDTELEKRIVAFVQTIRKN
jgi:hypothetical protein